MGDQTREISLPEAIVTAASMAVYGFLRQKFSIYATSQANNRDEDREKEGQLADDVARLQANLLDALRSKPPTDQPS